jgi:RHS repeat-associated protein
MFSPVCSSSLRLFNIVLILFAAFSAAMSQSAARPDRGATLNRNYLVSDVENISLQNGGVNLNIPLASLPPIAGGKLSWGVGASYSSKIWNVARVQEEPLGSVFLPYVVDVPSAWGGWNVGSTHRIEFRDARDDFDRIQYEASSGLPQSEIDLLNNFVWWKVVLVMPDGSEHELRPMDHTAYPGTQDFLRGYYNVIPTGSAKRYYSRDGTYLFATISSTSNWTVYMRDGTRISQTPDGVQRIQDTNGNKVKIFSDTNGAHYQDEQTGREIRVVYDPAANNNQGRYRVWYPTVGGTQHFIDVNMGTTIVQGKTYVVDDFDPINENICQRNDFIYAELPVVRDIVFPQTEPGQPQRKFVFSYNSDTTENTSSTVNWVCGINETYSRTASIGWGQLSRMIVPPGTTQNAPYTDYTYQLTGQHALEFSTDDLAHNGLTEKKLNHDGIVDTWTFGQGTLGYSVTAPDGNNLSEFTYCGTFGMPGCVLDKSGLSYRTKRPFKMTERHWINLLFSGGENIGPGGVSPFNAVTDYEYTTLLDASDNPLKMSAKKFQYDYNGNVTQTTEYDWFDPALVSRDAEGVPTGVPASATVLRVTNTSYYNQAVGSTSTNVYAKRSLATATPLILNAPKESTLGSGIGRFSYDGQAYNVAPTVGNMTKKEVWVDLESKWITTTNTYGLYGNLSTSTDGRGKVTQYFFDDATFALPNRIVIDPQNGTGTQTITRNFDYYTGLITSQTDANGQISTIDYTNQLLGTIDPFGRPGITKGPQINIGGTNHRQRMTTTYLDSARQVIMAGDVFAENDKLFKTRTTTDQLGRPVLTEQTEDGTNYSISVITKYLDMGRVILTSSPRRPAAASTDGWTRVTNDSAGRVVEIATFGGVAQPAWTGIAGVFTGKVTSAYDANFTTVTDQVGKVRRSMVDALGRLRRVDEPDGSGSLGPTTSPVQPTSYAYNSLSNLTTVTQGSQTRTFTYDSLSRLRTAVNPESGTVGYQYDDNGNVLVKTDARGVSTHYEYDSINRLKRRWYNGSNLTTATTHNSPALPAGVAATDEAKFLYDTQLLPTGAPSYSRGSAIGRLVAQTYGSGSTGDYYAYDVLGRQTLKIQQIGAVNYQMSAAYSLSSTITTLTYPSGHTVTNTYDQAARLTAMSGNLGDGTTRTYATGILYSALGGLVKEQFGTTTPVYNKLFYNSRGQLAEIRASTSYTGPTDTTWDRGAVVNSYSNSCTGVCSGSGMSDNNGNVLKQQIYIPGQTMRWQQYDYDSLNRLNWAREVLDGGSEQWKQQFTYDRYGNRTINTGVTYGTGINNKAFTVNTANNRLGVPGGQSGVMTYDNAGNLTSDTYTGAGNRTYDAESKMTQAADNTGQVSRYAYDSEGKRVKRQVASSQEEWLVYGFAGELLAEYRASSPASSPQKEYGYRNGQLLVTATGRFNVALAANGAVATASTTATGSGFSPTFAINSNYRGPWGNSVEGWNDNTPNTMPDWIQVDFAGTKTIDEISVFSLHDNYTIENTPTETQTFTLYGLLNFDVQYWNGSSWVTVPGGSVTGNNKVWRKFTFSPINTAKIRVNITAVPDAWSRIVEIQAFGTSAADQKVQWLISDQLGSPRMIFDQTGSLANMRRHDYLPFGEELLAPTSGRSAAQGYAGGDGVRQQFTLYERDTETNLDYAQARYYSMIQGRFTGPDPSLISTVPIQPQSFNRYSYCLNNPVNFIDPSGLVWVQDLNSEDPLYIWVPDEEFKAGNKYFDDKDRYLALAQDEIGPDGITFVLGELTGPANTPENQAMMGRRVFLGTDGNIHPVEVQTTHIAPYYNPPDPFGDDINPFVPQPVPPYQGPINKDTFIFHVHMYHYGSVVIPPTLTRICSYTPVPNAEFYSCAIGGFQELKNVVPPGSACPPGIVQSYVRVPTPWIARWAIGPYHCSRFGNAIPLNFDPRTYQYPPPSITIPDR